MSGNSSTKNKKKVFKNTHLSSISKPSCWYIFQRTWGSSEIPWIPLQLYSQELATFEFERIYEASKNDLYNELDLKNEQQQKGQEETVKIKGNKIVATTQQGKYPKKHCTHWT